MGPSPDRHEARQSGPGSSRVRRARIGVVLVPIASLILIAVGQGAFVDPVAEQRQALAPGESQLIDGFEGAPTDGTGTDGLPTATVPGTASLAPASGGSTSGSGSPAVNPGPTTPGSAAPAAPPTIRPSPPAPQPTPRPSFAPVPPRAASSYLLMSPSELLNLPTSGAAWNWVVEVAGRSATPNLSAQDSEADLVILARALVYGRTGDSTMRASVLDGLKAVVGTETGGRTLALGRNLSGFVIAADLIDARSADPAFDNDVFRPWLRSLFTKVLDGDTLVSTAEGRPNNWGTHAGAARIAAARYLGDSAQLERQAAVFHGWLGNGAAYAGFKYGDLSWQCDPAKPVGINPTGCTRDGNDIDGVLPDDQRRGGPYVWPPPKENYVWEALQGAVLQAELLYQAGYPAWSWENSALRRAVRWLVEVAAYPAEGDDRWQPWLIDARYGTSYRGVPPKTLGKNFAFTDWLYAP